MNTILQRLFKSKSATGIGQGLAIRQARLTVCIALFIGFLLVLIQMVLDYQNEKTSINLQLQQILESSSPAAAESLWTLSTDLANGVAEGLLSHPLIVEAKIETITGTTLSHQSRPIEPEASLVEFSFLFGTPRVEVIPLLYKGVTVGRLKLKVDPLLARQELLKRFFIILVAGLVKACILAGALGTVFYITLTRPFQQYANWVEQINPNDPEDWQQAPPTRRQHDELTIFAESIFQRFVQARVYFLELKKTRSELKVLNQELEERVLTRTYELKIALDRAEHLATTDMLTGIPNRRSFMIQAEKRHAEWLRHGRPYALLMMDLDKFKQINDTYGHPAGDQVLKIVASSLQQNTRIEDILGRIGGEEFCILLVGVSEVEAITLAERMRTALARLQIVFEGKHIPITASFGLVPPEFLKENFDDVLKNSDQMLYQAKNEGRNRVCLYHNEIRGSSH